MQYYYQLGRFGASEEQRGEGKGEGGGEEGREGKERKGKIESASRAKER